MTSSKPFLMFPPPPLFENENSGAGRATHDYVNILWKFGKRQDLGCPPVWA